VPCRRHGPTSRRSEGVGEMGSDELREFMAEVTRLTNDFKSLMAKHGLPGQVVDDLMATVHRHTDSRLMEYEANLAVGHKMTETEMIASDLCRMVAEGNRLVGYDRFELIDKGNKDAKTKGN